MATNGRMWGMAAGILLAFSLAQAAYSQEFFDDFNDGVRDKTKWYAPVGKALRETGGRLRLFSNTNAEEWAGSDLMGRWGAKFHPVCDDQDSVVLEAKLRVPHKSNADDFYAIGILIFDSSLGDLRDGIRFWIVDIGTQGRICNVSWYGGEKWDGFERSVPDELGTTFHIRLSFSFATGKVKLLWKPVTSNVWTKIRPNLRVDQIFFNKAPTLSVLIEGVMSRPIPVNWNVYLDDFLVVHRDVAK